MATLVMKDKYETEVRSKIQEELELKNVHQIPKLDKIVINFGLGESATNGKALENAIKDLTEISGQKPVITRAKKSIATFKVREGMALGLKVTLRKEKMYNFFSKLVNVALPRVRDFQGLSPKSFDGKGNYTFGVKEQLIFPEIKYDQVDAVRGMDIIICTSSPDNKGARALLTAFGFPFKKDIQIKEGM